MIEVSGLKKSFGLKQALCGIDISVSDGIVFALVGPDGAGKTTLLRLLAGILTPDAGSIIISGHDIVRNPESAKNEVGYLSQRFALNPVLTVEENINFFGAMFDVPRSQRLARIERLMEFSRLGPFKKRQAGQLSGGMKQKLSLCCSLIHTPKLLLLDEPTTGVDPISRRELWAILQDLLSDGVTIVFSTPYMDEAERANEVVLLHQGAVLRSGSPDSIRATYPYSLFEITCQHANNVYRLLSQRLGSKRVSFLGDRLQIALDSPTSLNEITAYLKTNDLTIDKSELISPGLEDLFIEIISHGK